jgi:CheY-like chemotaxis protein
VKILIAEDHRDSREALRVYLDDFGAICTESSAGSEAFDAFVRIRPDILLADIWMPDVDGLELIHCIRSLPAEQGRLTPAIAISAQVNEEQALMAGYHAVIPKPYDPASVVEAIKELVYPAGAGPSRRASWTLLSRAPGMVAMTFAGHVGAADAKASMEALLGYLEKGPCELVVDLRGVTGFSLAGASVAQRVVWDRRHAIRHVKVIGGSRSACIVASASCRLLGLGCTVEGVAP